MESPYFWFMMGKSSWVPSRTQGFIPIVADGTIYHGYCKNCFCPAVDEEWALGRHIILILLTCFCGSVIMSWHYIWTMMAKSYLQTLICFCYYLPNLVCNNLISYSNEWTVSVNFMWHVCWIMYDPGCMWIVNRDPSWYSTDYRVYMGSSMTVRPLAGYHCTCTLINWSVLR